MRFLSVEWLTAVDAAVSGDARVAAAVAGTDLRLLQVVTGGPEGDVGYLVAMSGGQVRVLPATPADEADVTLAADWSTAVAIAIGALAPHDAFTTGRLRVRGDLDVLRAQGPALAGLSTAFDEVRSRTAYA